MAISAPKGTKDTLPNEIHKWQYLEREFDRICKEYGYGEMRTPTFENTDLFNRGVGDTTDIVQKEMYTFEDMGHRSITLKPEGTSPAVRAFIEHNQYAEMQPSKYYYNTSCFRYEKPQAGRLREFHQFGIENFGTDNMLADAEVIALAYDFLTRMGIEDVELHISSVGCRNCRPKHRKALQDFLNPHFDNLCHTCQDRFHKNPMRILDCKSEICQSLVADAPMMLDYLCDNCKKSLEELIHQLDVLEIPYVVDPKIVRGLDYYTKTAFEFVTTRIGAQGTICGGGRYDHLIEEIGGPNMPGVGFGLGKERLIMLMESQDSDFGGAVRPDVYIAWVGDDTIDACIKLADRLRKQHISVVYDTKNRNLKGQLKYANKLRAKYSIVIGENEMKTGMLTLKNMDESTQIEISADRIVETICK